MVSLLLRLDVALLHLLNASHAPWLDAVALALASGGRLALWLGPAVVIAARRRGRWAGVWQVVLALLLTWTITDGVLKPLLWRDRPFAVDAAVQVVGGRPASSSFPSGHASSAFAGAFALWRLWPGGAAVIWTVAALVALGRVYQGVHYPLDVVAGALVGLACAYFAAGSAACYSDCPPGDTSVPR